MEETEDERLCITFLAPSENGGGLQRTQELYDCFEISKVMRLFKKIKSQIISQKPSHTTVNGGHAIVTKEKLGAQLMTQSEA